MTGSLFEIIVGAIVFGGSIMALLLMRPGADGKVKALAVAPVFSIVIPVAIVTGLGAGGAMLIAGVFPIFFQ